MNAGMHTFSRAVNSGANDEIERQNQYVDFEKPAGQIVLSRAGLYFSDLILANALGRLSTSSNDRSL